MTGRCSYRPGITAVSVSSEAVSLPLHGPFLLSETPSGCPPLCLATTHSRALLSPILLGTNDMPPTPGEASAVVG